MSAKMNLNNANPATCSSNTPNVPSSTTANRCDLQKHGQSQALSKASSKLGVSIRKKKKYSPNARKKRKSKFKRVNSKS